MVLVPARRNLTAFLIAIGLSVVTITSSLVFLGWGRTFGQYGSTVMESIMTSLIIIVLAYVTDHMAKRMQALQARRVETLLQTEMTAEQDRLRTNWNARLTALAGDLIFPLADGQLDPTRPEVRREAKLVEARIRDELQLGESGTAFAQALDAARRRGWHCQVDVSAAGPPDPTPIRDLFNEIGEAVPGQKATIRITPNLVKITITNPGLTNDQLTGLSSVRSAVQDEDFTQVELLVR